MGKYLRYIFLLSLPVFACRYTAAQLADNSTLRQQVGISLPVSKHADIIANYRFSIQDNPSKFQSSLIALGFTREIYKDWNAGVEYRYYASSEKDKSRFRAFTEYTHHKRRLGIGYRLQYQQRREYQDGDPEQYQTRNVFRNRIKLKYELGKKVGLYTYGEFFSQVEQVQLNTYRVRCALGLDFKFKQRHFLNVELFLNRGRQLEDPKNTFVGEISYSCRLKGLQKKNNSAKTK